MEKQITLELEKATYKLVISFTEVKRQRLSTNPSSHEQAYRGYISYYVRGYLHGRPAIEVYVNPDGNLEGQKLEEELVKVLETTEERLKMLAIENHDKISKPSLSDRLRIMGYTNNSKN